MISITNTDRQVKYCRGGGCPKRSCSMRKSGRDKGCLPLGNPPTSCDPGPSPVADQGRPVSGPQVQESMCLVGHFLSQREHGKVCKAVESKMSAADRVSTSTRQLSGQTRVPELGYGSSSTVPPRTLCHAPQPAAKTDLCTKAAVYAKSFRPSRKYRLPSR